ncbi:cytochrome c oxidase subunit II [Anaerobacillus sp. CMMVII]|uniref:cytochrome c oxidase subunit II n=1 Tax=Anaerobacillus sp. CMMVII TaxID=2755588 RepID=UPI0021B7BCD3|nr:cytochrome c oxidase subunit II [Anaerobacillus sp. CMMVII]MCT8139063.1 cytochrome c oxidase subunit II [Anaerobacillus sp. CMMVII]
MKQLSRLLPLTALLLLLAGCGEVNLTALDPQGPVAEMQLSLIKLSLYVMIFVIVVVFAIFAFVLWRYREKPGDTHIPKQVEGNHTLEIIWTTVPIILLIIIAIPNVMDTFTLADVEPDENSITVNVTGHQFWWEFEYPDHNVVAGQDMYIPTGTKIIVNLEASDVMHSFWVPALAGKQDNVPGITNEMWIKAENPGIYKGKCTELCGEAHWLMDFKVIAVEPEVFEAWATNMSQPEQEPATQVAEAGREVFQASCIGCHAVGGVGGNPAVGGPDLTNFGERTVIAGFLEFNDENLEEWIRFPEKTKPGNKMPAFNHLNDEEMKALIEYMKGLKVLD